jgi:hypothetical protein
MRFVIAGNITPSRKQKISDILEEIQLPRGERFIMPDEVVRTLKKPVCIPNETVDTLYFYIDTFMNRRLEEHELDALSLVNALLTETLYSKILGTARGRYSTSLPSSWATSFAGSWPRPISLRRRPTL